MRSEPSLGLVVLVLFGYAVLYGWSIRHPRWTADDVKYVFGRVQCFLGRFSAGVRAFGHVRPKHS